MIGNMNKNDWNCPQCGTMNFASRSMCIGCGCFRSKAFSGASGGIQMKKGDWKCGCGEINFASRQACRKCNKGKPNEAPPFETGDWYCGSCKTHNFKTRNTCFSCKADRSVEQVAKQNDEYHDDTCVVCLDRPTNTVVTTCGHLGYCYECALSMHQCPICRKDYNPDVDLLKVFKAN